MQIVAGVFTLINNWLLNNGQAQLGFVNPLLYKMAAAQPNTFNRTQQLKHPTCACICVCVCVYALFIVRAFLVPSCGLLQCFVRLHGH